MSRCVSLQLCYFKGSCISWKEPPSSSGAPITSRPFSVEMSCVQSIQTSQCWFILLRSQIIPCELAKPETPYFRWDKHSCGDADIVSYGQSLFPSGSALQHPKIRTTLLSSPPSSSLPLFTLPPLMPFPDRELRGGDIKTIINTLFSG